MSDVIDLFVIGGGINGVAIAADAAGRGLSVTLCEQDDLASHTSSWSSKLIHGGLRYLEYLEFKLVREALTEREILLKTAPHLVHPVPMVLPHHRYSRPSWMLRLGLFLYDHMGVKHTLPKSHKLKLATLQENPIKPEIKKGFVYSDCATDDSRLVVSVALRAHQKGAVILTRHQVTKAARENGLWQINVHDQQTGTDKTFRAKMLINAAGPWVDNILADALHQSSHYHVRLVKGSHMVFPRLYHGDHAYVLQHRDKRIVFVIPYLDEFTLVGTTDVNYQGDPAQAKISNDEKHYLCDIVQEYFNTPLEPKDAVWCFSGVRPLLAEAGKSASAVSRDYKLELNAPKGEAPLLSVFGGKLTTHRHLAEAAMTHVRTFFKDLGPRWTNSEPLPGGDLTEPSFERFKRKLNSDYTWLPKPMLNRIARAYGKRCYDLLGKTQSLNEMGQHFGGTLYEKEVTFLCETEWAMTAEDILWRRTKQGIHFTDEHVEKLQKWLSMKAKPEKSDGDKA